METSDHRQVLKNLRTFVKIMGREEILEELPKCHEPLIIYEKV